MDRTQLDAGLAALTAAAENGNPAARQKSLMEKATASTITPEENDELIKSLGGAGALTADVNAPFEENGELQKSIDVSPYLRENNEALTKSLGVIASHLEKSDAQEQGFRIALASTLVEVGSMVKSLTDQVAALSGQPAGPVKSAGVRAPDVVEKGFAGEAPQGDVLSKSKVLDLMEEISGENDGFSKGGENMSIAIAKYEGGTELSPKMAQEIKALHLSKRAA